MLKEGARTTFSPEYHRYDVIEPSLTELLHSIFRCVALRRPPAHVEIFTAAVPLGFRTVEYFAAVSIVCEDVSVRLMHT